MWDAAAFHMLIKKRGRVPASDSFVVRRIAGPGLASNYFYQASLFPVTFVLCLFYFASLRALFAQNFENEC
jgi:hypothetical protein